MQDFVWTFIDMKLNGRNKINNQVSSLSLSSHTCVYAIRYQMMICLWINFVVHPNSPQIFASSAAYHWLWHFHDQYKKKIWKYLWFAHHNNAMFKFKWNEFPGIFRIFFFQLIEDILGNIFQFVIISINIFLLKFYKNEANHVLFDFPLKIITISFRLYSFDILQKIKKVISRIICFPLNGFYSIRMM